MKPTKLKLITGKAVVVEIDHKATGESARKARLSHGDCGISLREMANRMGISAAYLSDLELGRRGWSQRLVDRFNEAIGRGL